MAIRADFKVDKNVPLPPRDILSRTRKQQIQTMCVGDIFLLDECATTGDSLVIAYCRAMREFGMRAACRVVDGGVRIWRIDHESPTHTTTVVLPTWPVAAALNSTEVES